MSLRVGDLIVGIRADLIKLRAGMKMGKTEVKSFIGQVAIGSKGLKTFSRHAAVAGATAAVVMGFATKVFADFEQQIANTASVVGAMADEMQQLEVAAREMGKTTIFTASQSAQAMYYLASAGYDTQKIIGALKGTLDLAAATQYDLAETTRIVVSTLKQFSMVATDATKVANVYSAVISKSQAMMDKLGESMKYIGPIAASLNFPFEQVVATLGKLYDSGLSASQAGTSLRMSMIRLQKITPATEGALKRLGLAVEDVNPQTKDLIQIISALERGLQTGAEAGDEYAEIFGARAVTAMQILTRVGSKALRQLQEDITDTNKAAEMAEIQIDTLKGGLKLFVSALQEVAIQLGSGVEPMLRLVIDGMTTLTRGFANLPQPLKQLIGLFGALAAVFLLVSAGATAFLAVLPHMIAGMGLMAGTMGTLLPVLGGVAIAMAGITAALVILGIRTDDAMKKFENFERASASLKEVEESTDKLITKYKELNEKVDKSAEEHDELRRTVEELARQFPEAVEGINTEGRALAINTEKIQESIRARKALLRVTERETYDDLKKSILRLVNSQTRLKDSYETTSAMAASAKTQIELYGDAVGVLRQDQIRAEASMKDWNERAEESRLKMVANREQLEDLARALSFFVDMEGMTAESLAEMLKIPVRYATELLSVMQRLAKEIPAVKPEEILEGASTAYEEALRKFEIWKTATEEGVVSSTEAQKAKFSELTQHIIDEGKASYDEQVDFRRRILEYDHQLAEKEKSLWQRMEDIKVSLIEDGLSRKLAAIEVNYEREKVLAEGNDRLLRLLEEQRRQDSTKAYQSYYSELARDRSMDANQALLVLQMIAQSETLSDEQRIAVHRAMEEAKTDITREEAEERIRVRAREAQQEAQLFRMILDMAVDFGKRFGQLMAEKPNQRKFFKGLLMIVLDFLERYFIALKAAKLIEAGFNILTAPKAFAELALASAAIQVARGAIASFAAGGFVPGSRKGQIVRVGEGQAGEYIYPEDKIDALLRNIALRAAGLGHTAGPGELNERMEYGGAHLAQSIGKEVASQVDKMLTRRTQIEKGHGGEMERIYSGVGEPTTMGTRQWIREEAIPEILKSLNRGG